MDSSIVDFYYPMDGKDTTVDKSFQEDPFYTLINDIDIQPSNFPSSFKVQNNTANRPQANPIALDISLSYWKEIDLLDNLKLSPCSPTTTQNRYRIQDARDIQRLVEDDGFREYLPSMKEPPLEIKSVYNRGKGVFALENINHLDKPLGEYLGEFVSTKGVSRGLNNRYIFTTENGYINSLYKRGWTAYINHSRLANVYHETVDGRILFYPQRPIKSGEQLLVNYGRESPKDCPLYSCGDDKSDEDRVSQYKKEYYHKIITWIDPEVEQLCQVDGQSGDTSFIVPRLFHAILNNRPGWVKLLLLSSPPDICAYAVEKKWMDGFTVLLPSYQQQCMTPLMLASYYGYVDIIKLLVRAGADLNRPMFENGYSALSIMIDSTILRNKGELADFIINECYYKIQNFDYLLDRHPKIINFLLQVPLREGTVEILYYFLKPKRNQRLHRKHLLKAADRISITIFKSASFRVVDTIWSIIMDKTNPEMPTAKLSKATIKKLNHIYKDRKKKRDNVLSKNKNYFLDYILL